MERALARHDDLLRQAIDAYGGHVVKTVGDGFQAVFTTAPAALDAALAAEPWGPTDLIQVRVARRRLLRRATQSHRAAVRASALCGGAVAAVPAVAAAGVLWDCSGRVAMELDLTAK